MKIYNIFAEHLYAFHYHGENDNEYDRMMDLWTDIYFLREFAKANNVTDKNRFVNDILANAEEIQDFLENLSKNNEPYGYYFEPLKVSEFNKILSLQKGKIRMNRLRYYAIKLNTNCFVITGGAIKMSQKMQDHPDTANELVKLNKAKAFLEKNGVFDEGSFFELINEQQ